jgi:hypothetical protein
MPVVNNTTILALALSEAFDWLDQVIADLTPEQYAWQPAGSANRIDRLHAHTLSAADFWVNMMGLGKPLLWLGVAPKAGLPPNPLQVWTADTIRLEDMQAYAKDLRASALPAIEALDDSALAREMDTRYFGTQNVGYVLRLAALQLAIHTGEISATKGLQGLKGLPV